MSAGGFVPDAKLEVLLQNNNLGRHFAVFVENEVDYDAFLCLSDENMAAMGIKIGPVAKLRRLIDALNGTGNPLVLPLSSPSSSVSSSVVSLHTPTSGGTAHAPATPRSGLSECGDFVWPADGSSSAPSGVSVASGSSQQAMPSSGLSQRGSTSLSEHDDSQATSVASSLFGTDVTSGASAGSSINGEAEKIPLNELQIGSSVLARGAQGSVYKGQFRNIQVAVKMVDRSDDKKEARMLASLRHENIVRFYGYCERSPNTYLVMEFADGGTLHSAIHNRVAWDNPGTAFRWLVEIARGMRYLHTEAPPDKGIVIHRDLKPENVLICGGTVKISDFGTSRQMQHTAKMSHVGTYSYMSPEALREEGYGVKGDVWGFGVTFWEIMVTHQPYAGLNPTQILYKVALQQLGLHVPTSLPPVLSALLGSCISWDPKLRPSFAEIVDHLEQRVLTSELVSLSPQSYAEMAQKWRDECVAFFMNVAPLSVEDASAVQSLSQRQQQVEDREKAFLEKICSDLQCCRTLVHFQVDVLGWGIAVEKRRRPTFTIMSCLDILSAGAFFRDKYRRASNRTVALTNWIPLFINEEHALRAQPYLEAALHSILTGREQATVLRDGVVTPEDSLEIFFTLMHQMVVPIVQEQEALTGRALDGFCSFHRWLLHYAELHPRLCEDCEERARAFLEAPVNRNKLSVPDLGKFMVLITLANVSWDQLVRPFVEESLSRQILWILKNDPTLCNALDVTWGAVYNDAETADIVQRCFARSTTGIRLILFIMHFCFKVARPPNSSRREIAMRYDEAFGSPSQQIKSSLQTAYREIMAISSYPEYFARVGYECPDVRPAALLALLRRSASLSAERKYHYWDVFRQQPTHHRQRGGDVGGTASVGLRGSGSGSGGAPGTSRKNGAGTYGQSSSGNGYARGNASGSNPRSASGQPDAQPLGHDSARNVHRSPHARQSGGGGGPGDHRHMSNASSQAWTNHSAQQSQARYSRRTSDGGVGGSDDVAVVGDVHAAPSGRSRATREQEWEVSSIGRSVDDGTVLAGDSPSAANATLTNASGVNGPSGRSYLSAVRGASTKGSPNARG